MSIMKTCLLTCMSLTVPFVGLSAESTPRMGYDNAKELMVRDIDYIRNVLEIKYAPVEWKATHYGWDLDEEVTKAKQTIIDSDNLSTKQFQQVVRKLLGSTSDHHVSVLFYSTEFCQLPFEVTEVEGHYYIHSINRERLPSRLYKIEVGDEILSLNGRSVSDLVNELVEESGTKLVTDTSMALAEMSLTQKSGMAGDVIYNEPVTVKLKSASTGKVSSYQLMWDYYPERIKDIVESNHKTKSGESLQRKFIRSHMMAHPFAEKFLEKAAENAHLNCVQKYRLMGDKEGFLPNLGKIVWSAEKDVEYRAYIFEDDAGRKIGYLRIPHYIGESGDVKDFAKIIDHLENNTDALVLDQLNNPGGSVFYLYALASYLTDKPLYTPKHRMSITQEDVYQAVWGEMQFSMIRNDKEAMMYLEDAFDGYPASYQLVQFIVRYCRFIQDEWNAGRTLTNPSFIYGVDHINPAPSNTYTKPILMLINELCFSGGDFLPAILQDNKRVTLFGNRTAGAGGYVDAFRYANQFGVAEIRYTASLAERLDEKPIENLGVQPDITCKLSVDDLSTGFGSYKEEILNALNQIMENE